MAKGKISSSDLLALMDNQDDQPSVLFAAEKKVPSDERVAVDSVTSENIRQTYIKHTPEHTPYVSQTYAKHTTADLNQITKHTPTHTPEHTPYVSQTYAKTDPFRDLHTLVGLQRNILGFIYSSCRQIANRTSAPIGARVFSTTFKSTLGAVRKAVDRLLAKGFIIRKQTKDGRGGWTQYEIPEGVYMVLLQDESKTLHTPNISQTYAKHTTQPTPIHTPSSPSSSSFLDLENLNTTTGSQPSLFEDAPSLIPEWQQVDFSPLAEVGFTQNHLIQIASQNKLKPEVTQDSIFAFAFDLKENSKAKSINTAPLNYFLGILRKGNPYTPPENYESPDQQALRKYLVFKKAEKAKRFALEQELQDLEFDEWHEKLSETEKVSLCPSPMQEGLLRKGTLRNYFDIQVWPRIKERVVNTVNS